MANIPPLISDPGDPASAAVLPAAADQTGPLAVEQVEIWGLPLARIDVRGTVELVDRLIAQGRPSFFITANLHYAMLADRDPRLVGVNRRAAFLVADGMPMVWYSRLLGRPLPQRVTGADLVYLLCQRAASAGHRVFLLGGAQGVAAEAAEVLSRLYPGLQLVGSYSPPFGPWTPEADQATVAAVRRAQPDLLIAALGQPKGELWLDAHIEALGVPVCVQVGASLDFVVGRAQRAPRWLQRTGLEWLYRLLHEPRRLAGRYFHNALFLAKALARDAARRGKNG
jgi:N-acetylglucosaminyldiphosphoundecaprenol N-acetyl-beta-D-mannosaminyltransferase